MYGRYEEEEDPPIGPPGRYPHEPRSSTHYEDEGPPIFEPIFDMQLEEKVRTLVEFIRVTAACGSDAKGSVRRILWSDTLKSLTKGPLSVVQTITPEDIISLQREDRPLSYKDFPVDFSKPFGEVKRAIAANILMGMVLSTC